MGQSVYYSSGIALLFIWFRLRPRFLGKRRRPKYVFADASRLSLDVPLLRWCTVGPILRLGRIGLFIGFMVPNRAAGECADHSMMPREMSCGPANQSSLDTALCLCGTLAPNTTRSNEKAVNNLAI